MTPPSEHPATAYWRRRTEKAEAVALALCALVLALVVGIVVAPHVALKPDCTTQETTHE